MDKSIIINFFTVYWIDIAIVSATFLALYILNYYLIKYDKHGKVRKILLLLCIEAEKYLGTRTGEFKKEAVIIWIMKRYPILGIFATTSMISKAIDDVVDYINKYLSEKDATLLGLEETLVKS